MAPLASSSTQVANDDVPVEEIVFSCAICQATLSEVYATTESNKGFHSGSGDDDGIVTKMWITSCSHVTCAKHLENGAAPFHPKGMAPRAPCPKCVRDKGDADPKELYSIRGLEDGEYDSMIPSEWRKCPAIKLDSSIPGMSAVRFQYTALYQYAIQVRKHWKDALRKQAAMETAYTKERKQRRQLQSELKELQQRAKALEKAEAELKNWESRKPMISHYLDVVPIMSGDMESMRKRLLQFGVVMPKADYAFQVPQVLASNEPQPVQTRQDMVAHISQVNNTSIEVPHEHGDSSWTRKRKREDYPADPFHQSVAQSQRPSAASRDLMPPPLPKARLHVATNRELPTAYESPAVQRSLSNQQFVQIYQDNDWRLADVHPFREHRAVQGHPLQVQNKRQVHRSLPYDPDVAIGHSSQEELQERSLYACDVYGVEFKPRTAAATDRRLDRSSTPDFPHSRRTQHSQYHDGADYNRQMPTSLTIRQQHGHDDQVTPYVQSRGQPLRQQDERFRGPLQALSASQTNRQPLLASQAQLLPTATPLHQTPRASRPFVTSPFFREDERAARSLPIQRPPTRGSFIQPQYDAQARQGQMIHRPMPATRVDQRSYGTPQVSNRLSFLESAQRQMNPQSSYASAIHSRRTAHQYQRNAPVPQTPRNTQGLFHRPGRPPPSALHGTSRPRSDIHGGRVSLPLTNGPQMPTASEHDALLSQVPGVRGVTSQRSVADFQRPGPQYGGPRDLFSSAGGRRSVIR